MTEKIILFIQRDSAFLKHTGAILQKAGYAIRTATEMRTALSVLSTCSVGLIICDKELRDISGLDLLNFIKKDPLREKIPFMFLVSSRDQGGAFKAFELGAADYLVHPLEPQMLIDRVDEIFSGSSLQDPPARKSVETEPAQTAGDESSPGEPIAVPAVIIDVSRDGIIWLPGKIVRFGPRRLFVETALFGKPGVSLMARLKLDDGTFVLKGFIQEIVFDDFQKPAVIDVLTQEEEAWRRIHTYLLERSSSAPAAQPGASGASEDLEKTVLLTPAKKEKTVFRTGPFQSAASGKTSYDQRFYYSIIGKQLDNYRAITLIGAGSMGGVIQGWDVALEREVALKVISYELSSKEKFREMFIKEARVVSKLNHLNIAQIYYIGTSNDILYYAMEFIDGQTLKDLIARMGNLNNLKGLEYLITACEALHYVHQNGIVHRDMKPANIMITTAGVVKIVDFGVAVSGATRKTAEENLIIGSPMYMSPEQVAGLTLDYRSDIYSVGATFYHVFTGCPPFEAEDFKDIMAHHIKKPLIPMKEKNASIPAPLARIIEKMMAKDPLDRYKDFQCVAEDVKTLHARIVDRKRNPSKTSRE
ncbi:MAG: response regulator [Desulfobacteraceae bacterium]|nr:MAG: response regulator [Desulfobacteraceae bacterium]